MAAPRVAALAVMALAVAAVVVSAQEGSCPFAAGAADKDYHKRPMPDDYSGGLKVGPADIAPPRHRSPARIVNPRVLSCMASCDVASTSSICQIHGPTQF